MDRQSEHLRKAIVEEGASWTDQRRRARLALRSRVVAWAEEEHPRGVSFARLAITPGLYAIGPWRWMGRRMGQGVPCHPSSGSSHVAIHPRGGTRWIQCPRH